MQSPFAINALAIAALMAAGCGCQKESPEIEVIGMPIRVQSDLDPTTIDSKAVVAAAGTSREMTLKTSTHDNQFVVELLQHGEIDDIEEYRLNPNSFSLVQAAGETYEPPIPLLKYPMHVGDRWSWKGIAAAGSEDASVSARIETDQVSIFACEVGVEAVQTTVHLTLTNPNGSTIDRKMTFMFAPKRGLFKREFGSTSTREPACN